MVVSRIVNQQVSLLMSGSGAVVDPSAVSSLLHAVYGTFTTSILQKTKHLHCALVVEESNRYTIMNVTEQSPKSDIDWLLLNISRASSDSIIYGMNTVRSENGLVKPFIQGSPHFVESLTRWRRDTFPHYQLPVRVKVVTSGAQPPEWSSPFWHPSDGLRMKVCVNGRGGGGYESLQGSATSVPPHVEIGFYEGWKSAYDMAMDLSSSDGLTSFEAGSATMKGLYTASGRPPHRSVGKPQLIDTLMLSVFTPHHEERGRDSTVYGSEAPFNYEALLNDNFKFKFSCDNVVEVRNQGRWRYELFTNVAV